ncbi:MAG: Zn-dependent exopeptidase M28 [Clostridiales bacterium]|nr:Zn-dependent exopeptidase M28 [Clostridiales bacterium]MBQ2817229.1 M28 family peptidase [Clostridia bacterium]
MDVSARRAFNLLKELAFERVSTSPEERKAAERLLKEAKDIGVEANIEEFKVACGRVNHAKLVVTSPYTKEYEVTGYERAASTPQGGLDAEFYYAENVLPLHLKNVKDKIVLINGRLRMVDYEKLRKAGAAAILTFSGSTMDRLSESDCDIRKLRELLTEEHGAAVALNMRAADAAEIVRRGAKTMHIELEAQDYEGVSQNVCAVIEGTKYPDEIISFGAHYDSVYFSTGVYDNMSGSVIIMELMRYFAKNRPERTMKFNWYGSEEQGLLGSKAWVEAHKDELSKHVLMINIDVAAATLGQNGAPVIGNEAAVAYVDAVMKEIGVPCTVRHDIYSSDCIPFADNGVPSVNFIRGGAPGASFIHDRRDNLKNNFIDEKALNITLQQALAFAKRVDSAIEFPIERKISPDIVKKVDEYLFKKKA